MQLSLHPPMDRRTVEFSVFGIGRIRTMRIRKPLQTANQQFPFVNHFRRQMVVEIYEQLFMADHLVAPRGAINRLQFVESFLRKQRPSQQISL